MIDKLEKPKIGGEEETNPGIEQNNLPEVLEKTFPVR